MASSGTSNGNPSLKWLFLLLAGMTVVILLFMTAYPPKIEYLRQTYSRIKMAISKPKSKPKLILTWNTFFGSKWPPSVTPNGPETFIRYKCEVKNCVMSNNPKMLSQADAVTFHIASLGGNPPKKYPGQAWVFYMMESPCGHYYAYEKFNNLINWTMTYRTDSDIPFPYGKFYKRKQVLKRDYSTIAKGKTKLAFALISNCRTDSKRSLYIKELQKHISVDVYGACGPFKCKSHADCTTIFNSTYKFHLSFESRHSPDYVTEKFFERTLHNIIPVVRGKANYKKIAPDKSFINTADFKSPKELADYLKELDKDDKKYAEYFKWKNEYFVKCWGFEPWDNPWCKMCKMLNDDAIVRKTYPRMDIYWGRNGQCDIPKI